MALAVETRLAQYSPARLTPSVQPRTASSGPNSRRRRPSNGVGGTTYRSSPSPTSAETFKCVLASLVVRMHDPSGPAPQPDRRPRTPIPARGQFQPGDPAGHLDGFAGGLDISGVRGAPVFDAHAGLLLLELELRWSWSTPSVELDWCDRIVLLPSGTSQWSIELNDFNFSTVMECDDGS